MKQGRGPGTCKPVHEPITDSRLGEERGAALYSLHRVIDLDWILEAYWPTRKDGAPGIDGVIAADYEANLEANLLDLLGRIKAGRYHAPPVRRAYIPKAFESVSHALLGPPQWRKRPSLRGSLDISCTSSSGDH